MTLTVPLTSKRYFTLSDIVKLFGEDFDADTLDRANCQRQGDPGHMNCGFCEEHEKLRIKCGCIYRKPKMEEKETVNHPEHYKPGPMEVINIIEYYDLNFRVGNAAKYILRAGKKDRKTYVEDLKKAVWYLNREIEKGDDPDEPIGPETLITG